MPLSRHTLHPVVRSSAAHAHAARLTARFAVAAQRSAAPGAPGIPDVVEIPLKTVSLQTSFDAYIEVTLPGAEPDLQIELLVDSGNSTLILPRWEDIAALPNVGDFTVLADDVPEPWGCRAKLVKGPILLPSVSGEPYRIDECVFYACTTDLPDAPDGSKRTANFGAACLLPWTASGWNTPASGVVMQAPLSYGSHPVAEFDYAAAAVVHGSTGGQNTDFLSRLYLYRQMPAEYQLFGIEPDKAWMCQRAEALTIGDMVTHWPSDPAALAVIDTGGTCVFLSDPGDYVCTSAWPDPVTNPSWTSTSLVCESTASAISVTLGHASSNSTYTYTIDPARLPPAAQGLTLVMCQHNEYMRDLNGMNTGGLSVLFNLLAVDYSRGQIGWKPKA